MKNIIKCIIFICITIVMFINTSKLLNPPNMWDEYKAESRASIDVLFFGTSHVYCAVNPVTIWQETGIPAYVLGAPEQPMSGTYYYIKEAFKTQQPKLVIIELYAMSAFDNPNSTAGIPNQLKNIEIMPLSIDKLNAILYTTEKNNWTSLIFSIYSTHSRWKTFEKKDAMQEAGIVTRSIFKGHQPLYDSPSTPYAESEPKTKKYTYIKGNTDYLQRSIEYCQQNGAEVLLLVTPSYLKSHDETYDKVAAATKNADYLNMNAFINALNIDNENDWSDNFGHFNARGARKVSAHLASYLSQSYNLPNKKDDPLYKDFLQEYEQLLKDEQK